MKILDSILEIERKTKRTLDNLTARLFSKNLARAKERAREITVDYFTKTPTVQSPGGLLGKLAGHFGFPAGSEEEIVTNIIDAISQGIDIKLSLINKTKNALNVSVKVVFDTEIVSDLIGLPEAIVTTEEGTDLEWLRWLLMEGDEVIIMDYHIIFKAGYGRSGQAIMVPAGGWSVPAAFSGVENDNWITRTLNEQPYIDRIA